MVFSLEPNMAIYTIYAYIGKHNTRIAVHTFNGEPLDYLDLKSSLLEAAKQIYFTQEHQTVTLISLERHLPGRYKRGTTSYRSSRIRYRRQPQFRAQLTYQHNTNTVKVEKAQFLTPEFYAYAPAYWDEAGRKWRIPRVVPSGFEASLHSPAIMFTNLNTQKTLMGSMTPQNLYGSMQERRHTAGSYAGTHKGIYMAANWVSVEEERQEKEAER
jgi:hypothetical protein